MAELDDVFSELDNLGSYGVDDAGLGEDIFGDDFSLDAPASSSKNEFAAAPSGDAPSNNLTQIPSIPSIERAQTPQAIPVIAQPVKVAALPVVAAPAGLLGGAVAIGAARLRQPSTSGAENSNPAAEQDENDEELPLGSAFATLKQADGVVSGEIKMRATTIIGGRPVELQRKSPDLTAKATSSILSQADSPRRRALRDSQSAIRFHERAIVVDKDDSGVEVSLVEKPVKRVLVASTNSYLEGRVMTEIGGGFGKKKKSERLFLVLRPMGLFFYRKPTKYNYVVPTHGTEFVIEKEKIKSVEAVAGSETEFKIATTKNKVHVCQCPEVIARDEWIEFLQRFLAGTLQSATSR